MFSLSLSVEHNIYLFLNKVSSKFKLATSVKLWKKKTHHKHHKMSKQSYIPSLMCVIKNQKFQIKYTLKNKGSKRGFS